MCFMCFITFNDINVCINLKKKTFFGNGFTILCFSGNSHFQKLKKKKSF